MIGSFNTLLAAGAFAGVFAAGASVLGDTVRGAAFAFVSAGAAAFAFASGATLVLASDVLAFVFEFDESAGASGLLDKTEIFPVSAGIARNKADSMNVVAAMIVTLDKTVAVPRGANAELDTLLVNKAPASVLPGCNRTAAIRVRQERKNIP